MFFSLVLGPVTAPAIKPSGGAPFPALCPPSELPEGAKVHDVIVVGSGPAGYMAMTYTARAGLNLFVLVDAISTGDTLMNTTEAENLPGFPEGVQRPELIDKMRKQAEKLSIEIRCENVATVNFSGDVKILALDDKFLYARSMILTAGSEYRHTNVEGEDRLLGRGISYCTTCDGFFFKDKALVVIGGDDLTIEEVSFLTNFASRVIAVYRRDALCTSKSMVGHAVASPKVEFGWNVVIGEVLGNEAMRGLRLWSTVDESMREIGVDGILVAIDHLPRTDFSAEDVALDETRYITVEKPPTRTSAEGAFACGGAVDHNYRQAIMTAGSGYRATLDTERRLVALND